MHDAPFLAQAVLLFGAAVFVATLFRIIRAPAAIGFLVTGLVIGPSGLRLITPQAVEQFAELGLVMLLFTIGLELSPEPLIRSGRRLATAALLQIAVTLAAAMLALRLTTSVGFGAALVLSAAVALSSTAIVLNQLAAQRETGSTGGIIITGVLLLQDLFVILLMLFLPLFAAHATGDWRSSVVRGMVSVAGMVLTTLIARRILPILLHQVIRWGGRELTALFAVVMAITGAWLAGLAGWSWALGACIAGLLLSQTDMRHQLTAEILPFRDVFNALFFISMGMLVDARAVAPQLPMIAAAVAVTLAAKCLLASGAVRVVGWPTRLGLYVGIGLCTVSEFGYVLAREADRLDILQPGTLDALTAYIVGTMLVGATLFPFASPVSLAVSGWMQRGGRAPAEPMPAADDSTGLTQHVIIVGFGLNGQNLARVLRETGIPHCIIEMNRALVARARSEGERVIVGDAARRSILEHAGYAAARALVVAINDQQATRHIVAQARASRADLYILARTRYVGELETLYRLGANQVIPEEFETSVEIFAHVLKHFGVPDNVIGAQITLIRAGGYGMLRGHPAVGVQRTDLLALLEATATQTFLVERDSPACGCNLREIDLRAKTGVTIIAVVRSGRPTTNPSVDFRLSAGDVLVLVGAHKQLDEAKALLAP